MPLPKHQEWHIAYDLHPTNNFSTPPVKKMKIRPCFQMVILPAGGSIVFPYYLSDKYQRSAEECCMVESTIQTKLALAFREVALKSLFINTVKN